MYETMILGKEYKDVKITKGDKMYKMNLFIKEKKQWGAEMFMQEPNPLFYDSYEDYLAAMSNWKSSLQERDSLLMHPSKIKDLSEISVNEPIQISHDFQNRPQFHERKLFDPSKYRDVSPSTIPSGEKLQTLFIEMNTLSRTPSKQPSQKPLIEPLKRIKIEKRRIIKGFTDNSESDSEQIKILYFYRDSILLSQYNFCINRLSPEFSNVEELTFLTDLSPSQFKNIFSNQVSNNTQLLFKFINEFTMLSRQERVCQDTRLMARIYIFLEEMMIEHPDAALSLFFSDADSVSFSTEVIFLFSYSHKNCAFQKYFRSQENTIFNKLAYIAFSLQFIEMASFEFGSNKKVADQLKAYRKAFIYEKNIILENNSKDIFNSFRKSLSKESLDLHTSVFIILTLVDAKSFFDAIRNQFYPFYLFIGKLKLNNKMAFARISSFLLYNPNVSYFLVNDYFKFPNAISPSNIKIELNSFPLLSMLIIFHVSKDIESLDISCRYCQTAMFHLVQYVSIKSTLMVSLLSSICQVIVLKVKMNDKNFLNNLHVFKQSIISMFYTPDVDDDMKSKLLRAVCSLFSVPSQKDSKYFAKKFLPILFKMMLSDNDSLLNSSWTIFREWILWDPSLCKYIAKSKKSIMGLKEVLEQLNKRKTAEIQYILLLNGFTLFERHCIKPQNESFMRLLNPDRKVSEKEATKKLREISLQHKFSWLNDERKNLERQLSLPSST